MKLSIITINYNNVQGLTKTIQSISMQSFKDFEYIIIDGGSNDGSVNVIKEYTHQINYWVSEKDRGIYHAMNKGIAQAKGEYLLMLNSGDVLANAEVLQQVFENNNTEDILYGEVEWQNNQRFVCYGNYPRILSLQYFWERSIGHQAAFIKRSAHAIVGLYDEHLKICADWKFFILAFEKYNLRFRYLPFVICCGDNTGLSWNSANFSIMHKEKRSVIKDFFKEHYKAYKQFQKNNKTSVKNQLRIFKQRLQQRFKISL